MTHCQYFRIFVDLIVTLFAVSYYVRIYRKNSHLLKSYRRSNCCIAAFHILRRSRGRIVVLKRPTLRAIIPHIGVDIGEGVVLHFACAKGLFEPVFWFKGRIRRDYCGKHYLYSND